MEHLEDRAAPAVITWDGGPTHGGKQWLDPTNWAGDVIPGPNDDAVVPLQFAPGQPITLAGSATAHSVNMGYLSLNITTGALTIGPGQSQFGLVTLNGGTLIPLDGASITAGNIYGPTPFTIPAGVTLTMQNTTFSGPLINSGTLDVTGQVQMMGNGVTDTNSGTIDVTAGGTLSLYSYGLGSGLSFTNNGAFTIASGGVLGTSSNQQYTQAAGTTTIDGTMNGGLVLEGGVLAGTGTVMGPIDQYAGTLSPGDPGGVLTVSGYSNWSFFGGPIGTLAIALNGPGSQGQLRVTGDVALSSFTAALSLTTGYVASPGDSFVVVDNGGSGPVSGQFVGLPEGATLTAGGQTFRISYVGGDGNDVTLTRLGSSTDAIWDGAPDGGGTSGDANWTTAANWVGDVPPVAGDDLYFPATAAQKADVNDFPTGTAFHSITFTGSGYDISGNGIALTGGLRDTAAVGNNRFDPSIALTGSQVFGVAAAGETLFLGNSITGDSTVNLSKETAGATTLNAGTLRLDGSVSNSFAGTLTVNGGILELNKSGAVAVAGPLVIGDGVGTGDTVREIAGDQIADTASVTVNANGALSATFGDTIGTLTIDAGGSLNIGGSTLIVAGLTTINGSAAADTLAITGTNPFTATLNGTTIGPIVTQGGVNFNAAGGSDTLFGPAADTTWAITGANAGNLGGAIPFTFTNVENLTGGSGNDTFAFAPAGSVAGMIGGGGGTNALDYSAFTSPVHANLGFDAAASAGLISTYYPWYPFPDTGGADLTYHAATATFDLSASIRQESSSNMYPFKLTGPNGLVLDLLALPGATYRLNYLGGSYFEFTYSVTGATLPPAFEAPLFYSQLTVGGYATGRLSVDTLTTAAAGTASATGGIANIADVIGGAGANGIIGSFASDPSVVTSFVGGAVAGGPVKCIFVVSNSNPSQPAGLPEPGVTVTDLFPPALTGVTYAAVGTGGATGFTASGAGDVHDTVNVPVGATITYTVTGTLPADATGVLTNTATIGVPSGYVDPDPTNNSSTDTRPILSEADLGVTNVAGAPTVFAGDAITYTLAVGLQGMLDAQNVTLTDTLPAQTTFVSFAAPAGWTVTAPSPGGIGTVTATRDTIAQGSASQVFTLVVRVDAAAPVDSVLTNSAAVSSAVTDGDPTNNTADAVTTVIAHQADLAVTNTAGQSSMFPGDTLTYTLAVNLLSGDGDAHQVTVTDTIPGEATFVSVTAPAGWTVTTPAVGSTGTVTATLDTLALGSAAQTFTLVVRVDPAAVWASLTNTSTVDSSVVDPDPANNSADAVTQVVAHLRPAVTGSGLGGAPLVSVFDQSTGTVQFSFLAYNPAFTGGVRVAMGDVNGDGTPDIITGAGPGGGPHVKVFDGVTGQPLAGPIGSFFAFGAAFAGGVYVAAGDVNGDGLADVIVGAGAGGGPHVKIFSGADGSLLGSFFAYNPTFHGGVTVAAGDVNGDGLIDVVTGAGPGGGPHVKVFSGAVGPVLASFFAFDSSFHGGVDVAVGDLNGDGKADVVAAAGPGGGPHVKVFDGDALGQGGLAAADAIANPLSSFYAYAATMQSGVNVAVVDRYGGGGPPDVVAGTGPGAGPQVKEFDGFTPIALDAFNANDPSFLGGVFVG